MIHPTHAHDAVMSDRVVPDMVTYLRSALAEYRATPRAAALTPLSDADRDELRRTFLRGTHLDPRNSD